MVAVRLALLALLTCGCSSAGNGGAVVVRWRLIDGATGVISENCDVADTASGTDLHVDQMTLTVVDANTGQADACASCVAFGCAPLEQTTRFEIPAGSYLFSLAALACGRPIGRAPPPVTRQVLTGEVTNLDAIAITIPPGTVDPPCDGGT